MHASFICAGVLLVTTLPVFAVNWNFLEYSPSNHFKDSDWAMLRQIGRDALESAQDGEVRDWSNPETGAAGSIKPLRTYQWREMTCRHAEVYNRVKAAQGTSRFDFCRQADGTWKTAPAQRPAKVSAKSAD